MVIEGSLRERTVSVLTAPIMFGAVTSTRIFVPTFSALRARKPRSHVRIGPLLTP